MCGVEWGEYMCAEDRRDGACVYGMGVHVWRGCVRMCGGDVCACVVGMVGEMGACEED